MISEYRWRKLKKHLIKVEEVTGRKLRKTPSTDEWKNFSKCPILLFAPDPVKKFGTFKGMSAGKFGYCLYYDHFVSPAIYKRSSSKWWKELPIEEKNQVITKISGWIKKRYSKK
jgi:hypothetical protein